MTLIPQSEINRALEELPTPYELDSEFRLLVLVRLYMQPLPGKEGHVIERMMMQRELQHFLIATLELHYEPGVNPHTSGKTEVVHRITLTKLLNPEVFWHTTPGLHKDGRLGAAVLNWNDAYETSVWRHPDCIREEAAHSVNNDRDPELTQLPICGTCRGTKHGDDHTIVRAEARCICPATEPEMIIFGHGLENTGEGDDPQRR